MRENSMRVGVLLHELCFTAILVISVQLFITLGEDKVQNNCSVHFLSLLSMDISAGSVPRLFSLLGFPTSFQFSLSGSEPPPLLCTLPVAGSSFSSWLFLSLRSQILHLAWMKVLKKSSPNFKERFLTLQMYLHDEVLSFTFYSDPFLRTRVMGEFLSLYPAGKTIASGGRTSFYWLWALKCYPEASSFH